MNTRRISRLGRLRRHRCRPYSPDARFRRQGRGRTPCRPYRPRRRASCLNRRQRHRAHCSARLETSRKRPGHLAPFAWLQASARPAAPPPPPSRHRPFLAHRRQPLQEPKAGRPPRPAAYRQLSTLRARHWCPQAPTAPSANTGAAQRRYCANSRRNGSSWEESRARTAKAGSRSQCPRRAWRSCPNFAGTRAGGIAR